MHNKEDSMKSTLLINLILVIALSFAAADIAQKPLPLTKTATLAKTGLTAKLPDTAAAKQGAVSDEIWIQGNDLLEVRPALDSELDAEAYVQAQKEDEVFKFVDEISS
jgi:hypothetical protein